MFFARADIGNISGFAIFLTEHFVVASADGDGGVGVFVWGEKLFNESLVDSIVAVDEADEVAGGFF